MQEMGAATTVDHSSQSQSTLYVPAEVTICTLYE